MFTGIHITTGFLDFGIKNGNPTCVAPPPMPDKEFTPSWQDTFPQYSFECHVIEKIWKHCVSTARETGRIPGHRPAKNEHFV